MWIKDIELIGYRNYEKVKFDFIQGINVLYGLNGQGKTNLIEAISYISTLSSFRNSKNDDVIKVDKDIGIIRCNTSNNQNIKISILKTKKNIIVDNEEIKKLRDYVGTVNVICFSSDDINNFKDSPQDRRKFFDVELSKIDKIYSMNLIRFKKLIKQRNDVLKSKSIHIKDYLSVLDKQLVEVSKIIYLKRKEFVDVINESLDEEYFHLTECNGRLRIKLVSDFEGKSDSELLNMFNSSIDRDIEKGSTSYGIHKDDYECYLDDLNLCTKCSAGQQRISLLSIKLAILKLVCNKKRETPILILDDVFSELDEKKKGKVINRIKNIEQIFITTTSIKELEDVECNIKYFCIENGYIKEERM